jgi:hypothetical protein
MKHKLGICIPYRNRKQHLDKLIPHLSAHLKNKNIEHQFYVGHQVDDKLFNRGSMKNIAAHYALNDGCDYVAWHDVDMLAQDNCDYSYPDKTPIHIATKLSKYRYGLHYDQYFGGIVLFNKNHVDKTNGYSNEYWDWGQEDDDLFWRCYFENYVTEENIFNYENRKIANFNGNTSFIKIPTNREISTCLNKEFTISILFCADQQQDKVPIWLVGDKNRKFIEYPIFRKDGGWNWGISFNNSRAVTMALFDKVGNLHYNWAKRFENLWTWVTLSYSLERRAVYFYINTDLTCQLDGNKQNAPFPINENLRGHDSIKPFVLGHCTSNNTYMKGKIAEIKIFDKFKNNVREAINGDLDLVCHYDFNTSITDQITKMDATINDIEFTNETFKVIDKIVPHRREGTVECLSHIDEGYVNGTWAKGETTSRNERRFVTEMQQGKINYKEDGINKILNVTEVISIDESQYENTKIINAIMK